MDPVNLTVNLVQQYLENQKKGSSAVSINPIHTNIDDFEKLLDQCHLKQLQLKFEQNLNVKTTKKEKISQFHMDEDEFCNVNLELLKINQNDYTADVMRKSIQNLYYKINSENREGISWDDICSYIIKYSKDNGDASPKNNSLNLNPRIIKFPSMKDPIAKVIPDCNLSRFITISKDGGINILSSDLATQRKHHMEQFADVEQQKRRRMKIWVTDATCVFEINKLIIATASRDLQFYDMSTQNYSQIFVLFALPNVTLCLCSIYQNQPSDKCLLFFGCDNGDIHLLTFHMPTKSLFETRFKKSDSSWKIPFMDLSNHSRFVTHKTFSHVHSDWVKRIWYYEHGESLVSCSNNSKDSLLLQSINERNQKVYLFKVTKGIECFDYNKEMLLLATGGVDHILRLWDPYVTSKPMAILKMHPTSIVDLLICAAMNQVFSYSKDGMLCLWDAKDHTCLQTILIKFPFAGITSEHGLFPLCMNGNESLLISAEDCIAEFKFVNGIMKRNSSSFTHVSPVVSIFFLPQNNQIISVCELGEKFIWDVMSGKKVMTLHKYNHEEITAANIDESGSYLVTGCRDGAARLWNLVNGLEEKYLEAYKDDEITSILVIMQRRKIFMFGWSRKILEYSIDPEFNVLKADQRWLLSDAHRDDILSAVYMKPNFLCTSSYNGEVTVWNFEQRRVVKRIQTSRILHPSSGFSMNIMMSGRCRSSAKRRQSAKRSVFQITHTPVDVLLYLHNRASEGFATLVSAEGNYIKFWSIHITGQSICAFKISEKNEELVTSLATDEQNDFLISGSSHGFIRLYQLKGYGAVQRFSDVVAKASRIKNFPSVTTNNSLPTLFASWVAHEDDVITSISCSHGLNELYLFTASTDCCVSMWNVKGEKIGTFTATINPSMLLDWIQAASCKTKSNVKENEKIILKFNDSDFQAQDNSDHVESSENVENVESSILPNLSTPGFSKTSCLVNDIKKLQSTELCQQRSQIINDARTMKENCSLLGNKYDASLNVRMKNRHDRRRLFSEIDEKSINAYGGISSACSPFNALFTSNVEDFALPPGMPITPRMMSKSINPYNVASLENITSISH